MEYEADDIQAQMEALKVRVPIEEIEHYERMAGQRLDEIPSYEEKKMIQSSVEKVLIKNSPIKNEKNVGDSTLNIERKPSTSNSHFNSPTDGETFGQIMKIVTKFRQDFENLSRVISLVEMNMRNAIDEMIIEQMQGLKQEFNSEMTHFPN